VDDRQPIEIGLVQDLIRLQFPQWSDLPLTPTENASWNNSTFRLGQDMLVRLPTAERYVAQVEKEQYWLPILSSKLPLPIPSPLACGKASALFPRPWSIYRWIEGETANSKRVSSLDAFADDAAAFLLALQQLDSTNAPGPGPHNFHRGGSLLVYNQQARQSIEALGQRIDRQRALSLWEAGLASAWAGPDVWLHGDFAPSNMIVNNGRLAAVIDFGSCSVGDPACDLVIAWTFLDATARKRFAERMDGNAALWKRARAWTLWKAMLIVLKEAQEPPGQIPANVILAELLKEERAGAWF
jgi:aminoglycoside phosphotransferase (APT) family kinase protein